LCYYAGMVVRWSSVWTPEKLRNVGSRSKVTEGQRNVRKLSNKIWPGNCLLLT